MLLEHGATEAEIEAAAGDDMLDLLAADRLLVPAERRYTVDDVSSLTTMPPDLSRKFWRALGFADVVASDAVFTDLDIEAIQIFQTMVAVGVAEVDTALQLARVIGASMARIADAGRCRRRPSACRRCTAARTACSRPTASPAWPPRRSRRWRACSSSCGAGTCRRRSAGPCSCAPATTPAALPVLAVGFADMVGYTMISQQISQSELAALVSRFEEVAHDTVAANGGRVVKMIGDEVMFVADTATDAARIGLALAAAYADDEMLSDVRVSLAMGPLLLQDGDFFGPTVNLASRVVHIANPGSVVVTDEFHRELDLENRELATLDHPAGRGDPGGAEPGATDAPAGTVEHPAVDGPVEHPAVDHPSDFAFTALRPRNIKDVGRVQLWSLYRRSEGPTSYDRRMGRRWQRLAEVLRDLEELRERGARPAGHGAGARARAG